jgi:hypothetical protein
VSAVDFLTAVSTSVQIEPAVGLAMQAVLRALAQLLLVVVVRVLVVVVVLVVPALLLPLVKQQQQISSPWLQKQ